MTPAEREAIIKDVLDLYAKTDAAQDSLDALFGHGELFNPMWKAMESVIKYAALAMGDQRKESWLDWYIYDCHRGAKPSECEIDGKTYKVRTPRDLAKVIGADVEGVKK